MYLLTHNLFKIMIHFKVEKNNKELLLAIILIRKINNKPKNN